MRRREVVLLLSAGAALLLAADGHAVSPFRIGVLVLGNNDPEGFIREFRAGLAGIGYTEGQNVSIEVRSARGNEAHLATMAAEYRRTGFRGDVLDSP